MADSFGGVLRRLRVAASLTQEELADRASVSPAAVAALEQGRRRAPRLSTVRSLADALQLTASDRAALAGAASGVGGEPVARHDGDEGLLERDLEAAHLRRAIDHSCHGVGRLVVIEGPAGIGKTSLVGAARDVAREAGMNVRAARGSELEQGFAFGIVRQLLDPVLWAASESQRDAWLAGAAALAAPLFDPRGATAERNGEVSAFSRLHGLYWLCANLAAKRPLALFVDDAQWADDPSLAFFGFLARRLEELPILLVAAVRSATGDPPPALAALSADPVARVVKPRGLSPHAVRWMLAANVTGEVEEPFARACHDATLGNPFLLGELIRELDEGGIEPLATNAAQIGSLGPQRVADAVLARLERLSPAAPALARAVAILGDGASLDAAAALAGLDDRVAVETAAAIHAADLFGDEAGLTFAHPIIRAAIYHSVLGAERSLRHGEAAALLHERGASAEQIAAHVLLARDLREPWVLESLGSAATLAMAIGAPGSAVAYLRRALDVEHEEAARARLLAALGQAEALAGLAAAAEHLGEAVRLTADSQQRARVAVALAELLRFTGSAPRAVELLAAIEPVSDPQLSDRVEIERLSAALVSHRAHELLAERIGTLEDRGGRAATERERFELVLLAFERLLANEPMSGILELLERSRLAGGSAEDRVVRPPQATLEIIVLTYCDQLDEAMAGATTLVDRARRRGSLGALVVGLSMREEIALRRGDLADALADATEALELSAVIAAASPLLLQHPIATTNNVAVEQERSEGELGALLRRTDADLDPDTLHHAHTLLSRARLLLACGQSEAALSQLLALGRLPRTYGVGAPAYIPWRSLPATVMSQLGDLSGAQRLAGEELSLARAMGAPRAVGIALRALALAHTPPRRAALEEAVDVLARSPARLEHARALVDLGVAQRRAGERAASRARLRDGHELAALCGATRLAERARAEIAASGARVAPIGRRGVASLTPSERRVAELAGQGQANKDIGQALFITESTVETHLRHVYDKLDVRSRHMLGALLSGADAPTA